MAKSYRSRVGQARKRLERDERKARGERTSAEQAADDVLQRILPKGHKSRRDS